MIAGPCGVNFKNDIEFFEAIYEKGKIVNPSEAEEVEIGRASCRERV